MQAVSQRHPTPRRPEHPSERRRRRAEELRRRRRQRLLPMLAAASILLVAVVWFAGGTDSSVTTSSTTASTRATTTTPASTTTTTDPGTLPQTNVEPSTGAELDARMKVLFDAIQTGSHDTAMSVFFPESAYLQMKTGVLSNPASDYQGRLVAFYDLDLPAYTHQLGGSPTAARLSDVLVNPADAAWIAPGSCENAIGYWHLPGVRLVYTAGGATFSFRVASLISWRGQWYVVHLGPNPRPSNVGTVDDPQQGPGTPGPPGGC